MKKIEDLVQKAVRDISCYEVKTILEKKSQKNLVKLNLNENFAIQPEAIQELLLEASRTVDVRAYPPPRGSLAIKAIADFLDLSESEVSVANGADEVMDLLMKVFVRRGSKVIVIEPSFPMYTFFTQLYGGTTVPVSLKPDFGLSLIHI